MSGQRRISYSPCIFYLFRLLISHKRSKRNLEPVHCYIPLVMRVSGLLQKGRGILRISVMLPSTCPPPQDLGRTADR